MTLIYDWLQTLLFLGLLALSVPLLGNYMVRVFSSERAPFKWLEPIELALYRWTRVNPFFEMDWKTYLKALLLFNLFGFLLLFLIQLLQGVLPLNPQGFAGVEWSLAFNTAVSFLTTTGWQAYAGETTLSTFTQMFGITAQNFFSAASGNAIFLALIRGVKRNESLTIGNFWVDLTRSILYLLLPLSLILSLLLVSQGVIQTFSPYVPVHTLEGGSQVLPMGPVASFEAIKQLSGSGGGYFNTNSAHPFENPTPFSNFLECFAILLIPAAATYFYGSMIRSRIEGWILLGVMGLLWFFSYLISYWAEHQVNPLLPLGAVMEGQELRFGMNSVLLWADSTTATSNGSVNAMMSSLSPLTGGMALFNIMLGEESFGGVGVGMATMIMFILFTVFLAGLLVGRTPEYWGKKIDRYEMRYVMLAVLGPSALILIGSGISFLNDSVLDSLSTDGPHGLTELVYAFASSANNNGSAFAGLQANTTYLNLVLGVVMILGRLSIFIPSLAIAGSLAKKKTLATSTAHFSTETLLFAILLTVVIWISAVLAFFPVLSLGPLVEQISLLRGQAF